MGAADLDGDGDMDILSASRNGDAIAWYENTAPDFLLSKFVTPGTDVPYHGVVTYTLVLNLSGLSWEWHLRWRQVVVEWPQDDGTGQHDER